MEMLELFGQLKIDGICPKCNGPMFVGASALLCGHVACKQCFRLYNNKCPMCGTAIKNNDLYTNDELEDVLAKLVAFPKEIFLGNVPKIKFFFAHEKIKDKQDHKGETRLHKECRCGLLEDIEARISTGVNINIQDFARWTSLHEAVIANRLDVVELLLVNGALVNVPGLNYRTPLHIAVEQRNIPMVKVLVKYGGSVSSYNLEGKTPIDLCNSNDVDLLDALCLTPRKTNLYTIFTIPDLVVACIGVEDEDMKKLSHVGINVIHLSAFLSNKVVHYVIVGSKKPSALCLQTAMLQGAFIFSIEGFLKYVENYLQNPLTYLEDIPKYNIGLAVISKLHKEPPLFDSLHFYFNFTKSQEIEGYTYSLDDFKRLVIAGGGMLLSRRPSLADETEECYFPYHADKTSDLICATKYILYDSKIGVQNSFSSRSIKFKSSSWFIECINSFRIA